MISSGFLIESTGKFLICHASSLDGKFSYSDQMWSVPKGLVEHNETILEAAFRETFEETSLNIESIYDDGFAKIYENFFKYKTSKKLVQVSYANVLIDITKRKLVCKSLVLPFNIPENDFFVWVDWITAKNMVSKRQKELFSDDNFERRKLLTRTM